VYSLILPFSIQYIRLLSLKDSTCIVCVVDVIIFGCRFIVVVLSCHFVVIIVVSSVLLLCVVFVVVVCCVCSSFPVIITQLPCSLYCPVLLISC